MIWAILAAVGVPLWLCAAGIATLVLRNRAIRRRPGNVPVRLRRAADDRWSPGHGVWIHDVFVFRASPAAWKEALVWADGAASRAATEQERAKLHWLGDEPVLVTLRLADGGTVQLAARSGDASSVLGPFGSPSGPVRPAGLATLSTAP